MTEHIVGISKWQFKINANWPRTNDPMSDEDNLVIYDIDANSRDEARNKGFRMYCDEFPDNSQDINDYVISVGSHEI